MTVRQRIEYVPHECKSLEEAVTKIGDRRRIDYLPTIDGVQDSCQRFAYTADSLKYDLTQRGFGRGDTVKVWLPKSD